ncbi:hypothetical protein [Labrenzia sp. DG1229]|uniref:hypothetical protein n=1 Tax=Labrenzia sp. DG1229 TaxID=681847 RepID=UPI0012EC1CC5|nr:hypothetical protein [Labrenzia sp. DG1229]
MTSTFNSPCGSDCRDNGPDDHSLIQGYRAQNPRLSAGALSAARHFLKWAKAQGIVHKDINATAIDRFARHRCRCGRYSPNQLRHPVYMTDVRRFLRYLEIEKIVAIPAGVERLDQYLAAFSVRLRAIGYSNTVYAGRLSQARHFAEWALQSRIPSYEIDEVTIERFSRHQCRCGIRTKRGKRVAGSGTADRRRGAGCFVDFLREQGVIQPAVRADDTEADPRLNRFWAVDARRTRYNS